MIDQKTIIIIHTQITKINFIFTISDSCCKYAETSLKGINQRCNLKAGEITAPNTYVIQRDDIWKTIKNISKDNNEVLSADQKKEIVGFLSQTLRPDEAIREEHIQQIMDYGRHPSAFTQSKRILYSIS